MSSRPNTPRSFPTSPLPPTLPPHVFPHHPPPPSPIQHVVQRGDRGISSAFPVTSSHDTRQLPPFPVDEGKQTPKRPKVINKCSSNSSGLRSDILISGVTQGTPCPSHTASGGSQLSTTQDPCYFSQRPDKSTRPREQALPQTNLLTTPTPSGKSPLASSGGSSCLSRRTDPSLFSISSEYLSPPLLRSGDGTPPYRARADSRSLTMVPELVRSKSTPVLGQTHTTKEGRRIHRRHRRRHILKERVKHVSPQNFDSRSSYSQRERIQDFHKQVQSSKLESSNQDSPGGYLNLSHGESSHMLAGRRWSSSRNDSLTKSSLETMSEFNRRPSFQPPRINVHAENTDTTKANAVYPDTGAKGDMATAIRRIMTLQRVGQTSPRPPTSIILRKASKRIGGADTPNKCHLVANEHTEKQSCNSYAAVDLYKRRESGRLLITSKDVESVTNLIDEQVQRRRSLTHFNILDPPQITTTLTESDSMCSTTHDYPPNALTTDSEASAPPRRVSKCKRNSTNIANHRERRRARRTPSQAIHDALWGSSSSPGDSCGESDDDLPAQFDFLEKGFWTQREKERKSRSSIRISRSNTQQSEHEVVWKLGLSPLGTPSTPCILPVTDSFNSEPVTPGGPPPTTMGHIPSPGRPIPSYFSVIRDSPIASPFESANEQSYFPDSNDQVDRLEERTKERPRITRHKQMSASRLNQQPRLMVSEPQLAAVFSFPRLSSRKSTLEWHSPLPEIDIDSRSLYDVGLDMHYGLSQSSSTTITPKRVSWAAPTVRATLPTADDVSQPQLPLRSESLSSQAGYKGVLTVQPKAAPQIAISSEVGQSIDTCVGDRRRSSIKMMQRVRTVDSARKAAKECGWKQRRPPSVCPLPLPLSPPESISDCGLRLDIPPNQTVGLGGRKERERITLLQQKSPPIPSVDRVGIYRSFTGTLTAARNCGCKLIAANRDCDERDGCRCFDSPDPRTPSVDWIA